MESSVPRFQWVRCQLDSLRHCVTVNDLETALDTLPKTLDETYERILRNIPDNQEKVHQILQFLCFSERPMMLGELAEVVTVAVDSEGKAHYDSKNRMRDPSDVLTMWQLSLFVSRWSCHSFARQMASQIPSRNVRMETCSIVALLCQGIPEL